MSRRKEKPCDSVDFYDQYQAICYLNGEEDSRLYFDCSAGTGFPLAIKLSRPQKPKESGFMHISCA